MLAACGGAQQSNSQIAAATPPPRPTSPPDQNDNGGMVIEGQLGFIPQNELMRTLTPATPQLAQCYNERLADHPYMSGRIELKFRIGTDGSVRWVIPLHSTLGDRDTERCMLDRARALRFTRPRGGETETTYPLELEGGEDARPATAWQPTRLDAVVGRNRSALQRCRNGASGPIEITLYAAPNGTVASAGVSVANDGALQAIDCVVREVSGWRVPDPGSWYARATITLE